MPQPAQFTGKNGDDPNGFISSLEHYFKFKNIVSEEAKFNQIRNLLHIDVMAVVQTLPLEERQTYSQIAQFITYNYSAVVDRERTQTGVQQQEAEAERRTSSILARTRITLQRRMACNPASNRLKSDRQR